MMGGFGGGAMLGGAMGGLTDMLGTAASGVGQLIAQSHARTQARKQREFLHYMDSTKYQRAVSDLKAAGINPILAALGGGGSGGAGAAAATATGGVTASRGSGVMSSARMGALMQAEIRKATAEAKTAEEFAALSPLRAMAELQESYMRAAAQEASAIQHREAGFLSYANRKIVEANLASARNWEALAKQFGPYGALLGAAGRAVPRVSVGRAVRSGAAGKRAPGKPWGKPRRSTTHYWE